MAKRKEFHPIEVEIVHQMDWTAIRARRYEDEAEPTYDVWRWNVFDLKWARMSNTASGFGKLVDAKRAAKKINDEIQAMLDANRQPPTPMRLTPAQPNHRMRAHQQS